MLDLIKEILEKIEVGSTVYFDEFKISHWEHAYQIYPEHNAIVLFANTSDSQTMGDIIININTLRVVRVISKQSLMDVIEVNFEDT